MEKINYYFSENKTIEDILFNLFDEYLKEYFNE